MEKIKIFTPETISDQPFPLNENEYLSVSQNTGGNTYSAKKVGDSSFPRPKVAVELLSTSLNTRSKKILAEFEFTQYGAIQIGDYTDGESGDIKISRNGIVARDSTGSTTFALDGTTGDATFAGTIQTGALVAGIVVVGDNGVTLDGERPAIFVNDGSNDRVLLGKF